MKIYAFQDHSDGYYEIEVADGDPLPAWAESLTACAVRTPMSSTPTVEQQREAINRQRDEQIVAGVALSGRQYHTDDRFLTELLGMILGYQAGVYTGTQDIRTRDNEIVAMGAAEIIALASAVGGHRRAVYAESWAAKDAL